jgi:hypothetical protein
MGAASAVRFVALSKYPHSGGRAVILANAIARASLAVSFVLVAFGAPNAVAGPFFLAGGVIIVGTFVTLTARGVRPRRIRHAWRDIGDPEAWKGHRDLGTGVESG